MNKSELVQEVTQSMNGSKRANEVVDKILNSISESLKKGDPVYLKGFGSFKVTTRQARQGINPRTGETIRIDAKKVVKFLPSQMLKDAVQ